MTNENRPEHPAYRAGNCLPPATLPLLLVGFFLFVSKIGNSNLNFENFKTIIFVSEVWRRHINCGICKMVIQVHELSGRGGEFLLRVVCHRHLLHFRHHFPQDSVRIIISIFKNYFCITIGPFFRQSICGRNIFGQPAFPFISYKLGMAPGHFLARLVFVSLELCHS